MKNAIILGLGEVGSSWYKVVSENRGLNVTGIDIKGNLEKMAESESADDGTVMHICLPYINEFEKVVSGYIGLYNPDLVVVNTSAKPGTTEKIYDLTRVSSVHIPVRGLHPNIDTGIKTFVNFIGPIDKESAELAEDYLDQLGIKHETQKRSRTTELAKLLDTSYYGNVILFSKQVYDICEELGEDFSEVYTRFNETYNEGYEKLGRPHFRRPVLIPPQVFNRKIGIEDNRINGHCVTCNLEILKSMNFSDKIKFIDHALEINET